MEENKNVPKAFRYRKRVDTELKGGSKVQNHFRDTQNINCIMKRYRRGMPLEVEKRPMHYGDFASAASFQEAMNRVVSAQEQFSELPGEVKKYFNQNPAELINFINDPKNKEKAIELGLIDKEIDPFVAAIERGNEIIEKELKERKVEGSPS